MRIIAIIIIILMVSIIMVILMIYNSKWRKAYTGHSHPLHL